MQVRKLAGMGFNAFRVSFQSQCTTWQEMGSYKPSYLNRSITIANKYGMWIIVDYHGFTDLDDGSSASCWLSFWQPVVKQFEQSYDRIIWEPLNEPTGFGDNVTFLGQEYRLWINQARGLGDTHWIVVQNLCSYTCGFTDFADGYPTVADPAGRIFISLHSYLDYKEYSTVWNNATAEAVANQYYSAVLEGSARTGWPVLNTEGGTDPLIGTCGVDPSTCPPDDILPGSAGYTRTTLHFIQTLTQLYDSNTWQRINWVWWTMGSWTDTPASGMFGALATGGWGSLIKYREARLQADVNGDCRVNIIDIAVLLASLGTIVGDARYNSPADLNGDGKINVEDLASVGGSLGQTCA